MPGTSSLKHHTRVSALRMVVLFVGGLSGIWLFVGFPLAALEGSASASGPARVPGNDQGGKQTQPELPRGSRIPWQDGSYFLAGVNYPFYQDYGGDIATLESVDPNCNWAYSSSFDYAAIDADFADLQAHGAHVVRWWLFGDGRGAPEFDLNRMVTGFDATFFDHMDQAMEIAARHNIYIIWSLWDFYAFEHGNWLCGGTGLSEAYAEAANLPPALRDAYLAHLKLAQAAPMGWLPGSASPATGSGCMINAGGHRNLVTDTSAGGAQDSFFNNALIPMLQRYAGNRNIIGWEIMNEPEWALNPNSYTGNISPTVQEPVDVSQMRTFFARFTQAVHTYAPGQYATVGSASLKFMGFGQYLPPGLWNGLGFDYYGAHYYGWMEGTANNGSPMSIDYNSTTQQLDAPVVIGELPANGGTAPIDLPSVRRSQGSRSEAAGSSETSTLSLRYICTAYAPGGDPPCTRPYTASIEYDNADGTAALTQTVVLPPYGGWTGLVPAGTSSFAGAARIVSNGPVAAAITQTGILTAGEQVAYTGQDQANLTTWLPRITNQGTHRSRIAVQNTGVHTATATISYYDQAGTAVATVSHVLAPHGSVLIDPLLPGSPPGAPSGFQGSAIVVGSRPLVATAYELDPAAGSDAYNGEGQGYLHTVALPSVRNWGANGTPTLYVQNPCCADAHDTISYYSAAGVLVASQTVTLPAYGSASVQPQDVLPGGFEGGAIITSDQFPAAVMRSVATSGGASATMYYAGTQTADQRFHFPVVHRLNGDGSGQDTSFSVQNISPDVPITVWVTLNNDSGSSVYSNNAIRIPPQGQWVASASGLPGVPAGFSGTAEVLWPWPSSTGWSEGFPLLATALDLDNAHTRGSIYRGIASHTQYWAVTPYTPEQLLQGIYANHWAGALGWSYYDQGTGTWDDLQPAMVALDAAHPADVRIGQTIYTPVPTPGSGGTATALAATNTPAYGNGGTATAVMLTGTPEPPCSTCGTTFSDVHQTDFFYTAVQYLSCRGIVGGYPDGTFRPYANATRAQFSKMLVLGLGWPLLAPSTATFVDVPTTHPFFTYVETAYAHGVISGYPCGGPGEPCPGVYFRPSANIIRGQISKLIAIGMGWPLLNPPVPTFRDVTPGSTFYQAVETVYAHGVISGYSCGAACLEFRPLNNATRGQLSKMLWFALTHPMRNEI